MYTDRMRQTRGQGVATPADNSEARRGYLIKEYGHLNERIGDLQATISAYSEQKADVVRQLRQSGLSVIEVADRLGLTRQAIYNVLQAAEGRYDKPLELHGPRQFLVQHLDLSSGLEMNWSAYFHTLEEAFSAADSAYQVVDDPGLIRQEIIDTGTGEWRFRNIGDSGWSPPTHGGRQVERSENEIIEAAPYGASIARRRP